MKVAICTEVLIIVQEYRLVSPFYKCTAVMEELLTFFPSVFTFFPSVFVCFTIIFTNAESVVLVCIRKKF